MALQLYRYTASVVDDEDVRASFHQYITLPDSVTGAQILTNLAGWATVVEPLTDGGFLRLEASLVASPAAEGLPVTPSGSEEVSEYGEFRYNVDGTAQVYTIGIPALKEAIVVGNNIDITNAAVIAFDGFITAPYFTTGFFCTPDGLQLGTRKATFLGNRKHRRQQFSKSYKLG